MEFHQYKTHWQIVKENAKEYRSDYRLFYDRYAEILQEEIKTNDITNNLLSISGEVAFLDSHKPYFKVWPGIAKELMNVDFNIPSTFLKFPFKAYEIRLPKTDNPLRFRGKEVTQLLVHEHERMGAKRLHIVYRLSDEFYKERYHSWYVTALLDHRITINKMIESVLIYSPHATTKENAEFFQSICRLAISVAFFGTNQHDLIIPDLPKKIAEKYDNASDTEKKELSNRAARQGHNGYRIGSREKLLPCVRSEGHNGGGEGRELAYGHLRRPHMHMYRCGPRDNSRYELRFISLVHVRPDLELKPNVGYSIK